MFATCSFLSLYVACLSLSCPYLLEYLPPYVQPQLAEPVCGITILKHIALLNNGNTDVYIYSIACYFYHTAAFVGHVDMKSQSWSTLNFWITALPICTLQHCLVLQPSWGCRQTLVAWERLDPLTTWVVKTFRYLLPWLTHFRATPLSHTYYIYCLLSQRVHQWIIILGYSILKLCVHNYEGSLLLFFWHFR
jgi:hypothetical protein